MFERFDPADVQTLMSEYPLAWMSAANGRAADAALLPLMGEFDANGVLVELIGHMGRTTALHDALAADPHAVISFQGPQAYVSPEHAGRRNWAPTWNFAQLRIEADVTFRPDETDDAVARLVARMEHGRPEPWKASELGDRYGGLTRAIVGFRAQVTAVCGRFKLGQDENDDTLRTIVMRHPDAALVRWMRRMNAARI